MRILLSILLLSSSVFASTFATKNSSALNAATASTLSCEVNGKFVGEKHRAIAYSRGGAPATQYWVYWSYEIQSRSENGAECPQGNSFDLRIREGSYVLPKEGEPENYIYPVHISVPEMNSVQSLKLQHIVGQDGLTKAVLDEWLVQ